MWSETQWKLSIDAQRSMLEAQSVDFHRRRGRNHTWNSARLHHQSSSSIMPSARIARSRLVLGKMCERNFLSGKVWCSNPLQCKLDNCLMTHHSRLSSVICRPFAGHTYNRAYTLFSRPIRQWSTPFKSPDDVHLLWKIHQLVCEFWSALSSRTMKCFGKHERMNDRWLAIVTQPGAGEIGGNREGRHRNWGCSWTQKTAQIFGRFLRDSDKSCKVFDISELKSIKF
jgi:hypothetical protein